MAVYRFMGGDVDISLFTDSPGTHKEFFVTDVQGQDPDEVMAGYDFMIDQMHEGDLVEIARDNNLALWLNDPRVGQVQVVMITSEALFNGRTSRLNFSGGNINIASSGSLILPLFVSFDYLITEEQWASLEDFTSMYFFSFDMSLITFGTDLSLLLTKNSDNEINLSLSYRDFRGRGGQVFFTVRRDQIVGEYHNFRIRIQEPIQSAATLFIDNVESASMPFGTNLGVRDSSGDVAITFGARRSFNNYTENLLGFVRNIIWSANDVEVINVANPINGTNSGTGSDAVVTDVVAGTI